VAVGDATVNCGVAVDDATVNSGVAVDDATLSSCVGVGNAPALGVATIGSPIIVGQVLRVGLCAKNWTIPEIIAAAIEVIPNAIAQRARR
jgi:hypothetical protein